MLKSILFFYLFSVGIAVVAQKKHQPIVKSDTPNDTVNVVTMPFNRLIQSAGKVITYGNPSLENHTLDLCSIPETALLAVEDRYGVAIINPTLQKVQYRWAYESNKDYKTCMSTYSGIKSFISNGNTYIVWSAAGKGAISYIMIAEWNGEVFTKITHMPITVLPPATNALPNDIAITNEEGKTFLYVVLNGNNQLLKINFATQQLIWSANTGVAPYGVSIINQKAYVTNWAGPLVTDTTLEHAGTPWGKAYTNPITGATKAGSLSIINTKDGTVTNQLALGLHPNAIISNHNKSLLYIPNGNSDFVSVVDVKTEKVIDSINVGLFVNGYKYYGSSPNALAINAADDTLYVANGLDNAIAVVALKGINKNKVQGYIPTEAYPSGIVIFNNNLCVTNLEAKGAKVLSEANELNKIEGNSITAYSIHKQLASVSIIPQFTKAQLLGYTKKVRALNLVAKAAISQLPPRNNVLPKPLPQRIGEPSIFKHIIYIIKENKTYDQVFGDIKQGRGDEKLCVFGDSVTPNQHQLATTFGLLDNYYASGKSSAEGHQWTDAAMVSDYIEKNVRAWFRSYPHRQTDALVYNKNGFIWNNALDHGKTVKVYGEACTTHFNEKQKWLDIYTDYMSGKPLNFTNTTTIARLRPIISPDYPDCDNFIFTDQIRASIFIEDLKNFEATNTFPNLMILSLPNDHTAGTSPNFPTPNAMVADNDLALGRIMEAITHSKFWDSTVVFVTEDDSQGGWDHISSYRTTGLVMSAYANNTVNHTSYNQTSVVRTIEQILGIPPMNVIDATASPMFDCFSNTKMPVKYKYLPNYIPLNQMNKAFVGLKGKALYYAKKSANEVFKEVDGGEDDTMNKILWFNTKGNLPYPVTNAK